MDYQELVKSLRICGEWETEPRIIGEPCDGCKYYDAEHDDCKSWDADGRKENVLLDAADAIEELLKAAKKMHTWIFLNSFDEQAAYDECGLSDEMNAALGYGGQIELRIDPSEKVVLNSDKTTNSEIKTTTKPPKEET